MSNSKQLQMLDDEEDDFVESKVEEGADQETDLVENEKGIKKTRVVVKRKIDPKRKPGVLTDADKYKIIHQYNQGKDPKEISKSVRQSIKKVTNFLESFKNDGLSRFIKEEEKFVDPTQYIDSESYERIVYNLVKNGINKEVAQRRVNKICGDAVRSGENKIPEEELFKKALSTITGGELFAGKSTPGVIILTTAASEKGDSSPKPSCNSRDHIDGKRIFSI
jgi:hypothetical protein